MDLVFSGTLTNLQRHEFFERHIGRTVIWQGRVGGVSESSDRTISVLLATPGLSERYLAFLEFAPEYKADLIHLNIDTGIKVVCRLSRWLRGTPGPLRLLLIGYFEGIDSERGGALNA
jgi:hypothetical protein